MPVKKDENTTEIAAGVEVDVEFTEPPVKEKTDLEKWAEMYGPDCLPPERVRYGYAPL